MKLRPHGAAGHPIDVQRTPAYVPDSPSDRWPARSFERNDTAAPEIPDEQLEFLTPRPEPSPEPQRPLPGGAEIGGGAAIAALAAALFLLACAYAAFSGYMHSYDDNYAYLGIIGAVGSLLAAGIGVCLAASTFRRRYSGRFLSLCAISLASLYGVLLFVALGH